MFERLVMLELGMHLGWRRRGRCLVVLVVLVAVHHLAVTIDGPKVMLLVVRMIPGRRISEAGRVLEKDRRAVKLTENPADAAESASSDVDDDGNRRRGRSVPPSTLLAHLPEIVKLKTGSG